MTGLPDKNGFEVWCSPSLFETLPLELVHIHFPYPTNISTCLALSTWKTFFLGILNTRFCEIKHNVALLEKHLEFISVKSERRLVEDSVCKMITCLLDLIKFYRTPDSS